MNSHNYMSNFIEQKVCKLPLALIAVITALCLYGILVLYFAAKGSMDPWGYKQLINFCIFMPLAIVISLIDLKLIFRFSYLPYVIVLILLIIVELFGYKAMGATRWVEIGGLRVQPAEPAKIALVLMLAKYFHNMTSQEVLHLRSLLTPALLLMIPISLIVKQPDLGTGLLTLIVGAIMFFGAGIRSWIFGAGFIGAALTAPVLWHFMHDYQKKRIFVFLNPELDPRGSAYNIIQSKIAIGSGGLFGKGLGGGTQNQLDFLPEHQTDFIFASLAEEMGLAGCSLLLILYALLLYMSLSIAINARSGFGKLLALGVTAIFFCHAFINMAMVMGLLPVVGLPLPFISYGGTMMVSMLVGFGLIMNVHVHRHIALK
jgi:rod shape determining protein RodA